MKLEIHVQFGEKQCLIALLGGGEFAELKPDLKVQFAYSLANLAAKLAVEAEGNVSPKAPSDFLAKCATSRAFLDGGMNVQEHRQAAGEFADFLEAGGEVS